MGNLGSFDILQILIPAPNLFGSCLSLCVIFANGAMKTVLKSLMYNYHY